MNFNADNEIIDIKQIITRKLELSPETALDIKNEKRIKRHNSTITRIKVNIDNSTILNLVEKKFSAESNEPYMYKFLSTKNISMPEIYFSNNSNYILMEDISYDFECLGDWDEEGKEYLSKGFPYVVKSLADFHSLFWEDDFSFNKVGLPWHFQNLDNFKIHLDYLKRDLVNFKESNRCKYEVYFEYFDCAYNFLKDEYKNIIKDRLNVGRKATVVHGDLNAANVWVSKKTSDSVKGIFLDLEAVRVGLPTDDLVMLLTFHIANDKNTAVPLLEEYYNRLITNIQSDYSYNDFLYDFKCSLMETVFFAIKLIISGIPAYDMIDGFIRTYETMIKE